MKSMICFLLILSMVLVCAPAKAQESFVLYDDFNSKFIDAMKWRGGETSTGNVILLESIREIDGQRLRLLNRSFGRGGGSSGLIDRGDNQLRVTPPPLGTDITALEASVKVNAVEAIGCPDEGSEPTRARARLAGSFFRTEGMPNGELNDVNAFIIIQRLSNSTDAPQVLKVFGQILHCLAVC